MEVSHELLQTICIVYDVIYAIIGFFGVTGNVLVILVIVSNRAMYTTTNIYIASMAISDLAFLIVCVPLNIYVTVAIDGWKLGAFLCASMQYLMYTTVLATCLTMSILAIDRFLAIKYPLESLQFRLPQTAIIVNLLVWAASCLLSVPVFVMTWPKSTDSSYYCDWQSDPLTIFIFYVGFFIVSFVIPMIVIIFCYGSIFRRMLYSNTNNTLNINAVTNGNKDAPVDNGDNNGHTDKEGQRATSKRSATCDSAAAVHDQFINNGGSSGNMQNGTEGGTASNGYRLPAPPARILNQRRRVTKMVTIIIVCFLVLWCPVHYMNLSYRYKSAFGGLGDFTVATALSSFTARALIFIASSINPVIYAFAGENFRGYMRATFNRCRGRGGNQVPLNRMHHPIMNQQVQRNPRMNPGTRPPNTQSRNGYTVNDNTFGRNVPNVTRYQTAAPRSGNIPSSTAQTYV